jgi:diguanylate cyclase (GGDEF)-like protein/PAS domain S-box-containing protein
MEQSLLSKVASSIPFPYAMHQCVMVGERKEFVFIAVNRAFEQLSGLSQGQLLGKPISELFPEETEDKFSWHQALYTLLSSDGQDTCGKIRLNGKRYSVNVRSLGDGYFEMAVLLPTQEDMREEQTVFHQAQNIASLTKEKEQLLRRFQSMFNDHKAVMLLLDPHTGRIVDANAAACEFYGYTEQELTKLNISDINTLPKAEVERLLLEAFYKQQKYFLLPHRLKNGEIRLVDACSCPVCFGEQTYLYSIIFDVSDREQYRVELFREKELLKITLHSIGDGVVTTDVEERITGLNAVAEEITGWTIGEVRNKKFSDVFQMQNDETGSPVENIIKRVLQTGRIASLKTHTVLLNHRGALVPIADSAAPIKNEEGEMFGAIMVFRDISIDQRQKEQILYLSYHDSLTELYNRRYVESCLPELENPLLLPLAVVMGDVNGLKMTNDAFGHLRGDALLKNVGRCIKKNLRKNDIGARWGGDEFLIFLPNTTAGEAKEFIDSIKQTLTMICEEKISVSFGFAMKESAERSVPAVFQEAEEQMYHQKLLEGKSYRNNILNTLLATLYERSQETEEHARRLKGYCHHVGNVLGLTSKELSELSLLAMLHDIGKVAVDQNVLQKPSALNVQEWVEMKRHSEIGFRIAQNSPDLINVAEYILFHHERWDGGGYPRGLRGEEIPLLCRILAVADAYDAMTSDRVYRKAFTKEEAIGELIANSGTQFDPQIIRIFMKSVV